jgi:hypothetical protein
VRDYAAPAVSAEKVRSSCRKVFTPGARAERFHEIAVRPATGSRDESPSGASARHWRSPPHVAESICVTSAVRASWRRSRFPARRHHRSDLLALAACTNSNVDDRRDTDAPGCQYGLEFVYAVHVSRRRLQRRSAKAQRHAPPRHGAPSPLREIIREATHVERLAYTRTQAAAALGISRSTFNRRVLPSIETVEMPWGARLVPVDELKRLLAEQRRLARGRTQPAPPGRPPALAPELVQRILREHTAGKSLRQIAADLNASRTPTAHGGKQWWPSTVRAVLRRRSGLPTRAGA